MWNGISGKKSKRKEKIHSLVINRISSSDTKYTDWQFFRVFFFSFITNDRDTHIDTRVSLSLPNERQKKNYLYFGFYGSILWW